MGAARFVTEDRRRARVLYTEALDNERLRRRRTDAMEEYVGRFDRDRSGAAEGRTDATRQIAAHVAIAGFTSALLAWLDGRVDAPLDELVADAAVILAATTRASRRLARGGRP